MRADMLSFRFVAELHGINARAESGRQMLFSNLTYKSPQALLNYEIAPISMENNAGSQRAASWPALLWWPLTRLIGADIVEASHADASF